MAEPIINENPSPKKKRRRGWNWKHGHCTVPQKSPEYRTWRALISRCENPKDIGYHRYGGRGITVCARWRQSFIAFFEDMGCRPTVTHTIDRLDPNGPYEKSNCCWSTRREQANNRRSSRLLTYNGETHTQADWARKLGFTKQILAQRIDRDGWSVEKALSTPPFFRGNKRKIQ